MRLGSDPEVFLVDSTGKHISAIGYINADKWNPMQIPDMEAGYTLQEDNVSLEYGIPPAASAAAFSGSINKVMQKSLEYLPNLNFSTLSCVRFTDDQLEHPMASIFGCEPDKNAWTGKENTRKFSPYANMRSAGGHIHVETKQGYRSVVKRMDLFLGIPSVLMDQGHERKAMYGSAGACRKKPYGVEYRTLSNFWIFSDRLHKWVWDNTQSALDFKGDIAQYADLIINTINTNDADAARFLVDEFKLEVV